MRKTSWLGSNYIIQIRLIIRMICTQNLIALKMIIAQKFQSLSMTPMCVWNRSKFVEIAIWQILLITQLSTDVKVKYVRRTQIASLIYASLILLLKWSIVVQSNTDCSWKAIWYTMKSVHGQLPAYSFYQLWE